MGRIRPDDNPGARRPGCSAFRWPRLDYDGLATPEYYARCWEIAFPPAGNTSAKVKRSSLQRASVRSASRISALPASGLRIYALVVGHRPAISEIPATGGRPPLPVPPFFERVF
jgi:hypothetical protein